MQAFEATIVAVEGGGAFVRIPPEVVAALGGKGRIPVQATFDGIAYRGSVVSMGGEKVLGLLKGIRTELGKEPGDTVRVTLTVDETPRRVAVPDDLRAALDGARRRGAFSRLSYTHQRERVTWIESAKRADTRARRVAETVAELSG
jgi:uncharacterized protein DUF1905/bacteriocin resistance YdeI/OmpD-like protein